jgi:hypothetical protein
VALLSPACLSFFLKLESTIILLMFSRLPDKNWCLRRNIIGKDSKLHSCSSFVLLLFSSKDFGTQDTTWGQQTTLLQLLRSLTFLIEGLWYTGYNMGTANHTPVASLFSYFSHRRTLVHRIQHGDSKPHSCSSFVLLLFSLKHFGTQDTTWGQQTTLL